MWPLRGVWVLLLSLGGGCQPWVDAENPGQILRDTSDSTETGLRIDSGEAGDSGHTEDSAESVDTGTESPKDADGDGYDSLGSGGSDCNDQNDQIHPRAGDSTQDWEDSDCDGLDCQAGSSEDGGYFVVCPEEKSWEAAANTCLGAGYDGLALIESAAQQDRVVALSEELNTQAYRELWFGMNDIDEEGEWTWMSGVSTYSFWLSGQPGQESDDSDCGMMANYDGYRWSDLPCTDGYRFVCSG